MLLGQLLLRVTVRFCVNIAPFSPSISMSRLSVNGASFQSQSSPGCCTETISVFSTKVGPVISQRVGP